MIFRWAARLLDIATTAFIGLLIGALVAVVGNIVGGTLTRIFITIIASAVIGAGVGIVWVILRVRRGEPSPRREPYLAVLRSETEKENGFWNKN
jgi:hypothetical protein